MQVHGALGVSNEMPFAGMMLGAGVLGLADGPTEVHKVTVARQVLRDYRPSDDLWPTEHLPKLRARPGRSSPSTSSTRWGTCDRRRRRLTPTPDARADGWRPGWTPGLGSEPRSSAATSRAAARTRSTRSAAATLHGALRIPPATAPAGRDEGILREWRIIEALEGTDVPHTAALAACADQAVLGRTFYLMGFVDGWSPMGTRRTGRRRSTPTSRRAAAWPWQLVEGIALLSKVDWRAKGLEDLGRPDGFHERQVDRWTRLPRAHQGPGAARLRRGRGLAARPPADRLRPRADARRLPVRQRDVPPRGAGAAGRHRRLGDGHGRRPQARPRRGWCRAGRTTPWRPRPPRRATSTSTACRARRAARALPEVSGRQVDDIDYYVVLARWKLAIVLEQGFQRAGRRREAPGLRAHRPRPDGQAAELAETSDYQG